MVSGVYNDALCMFGIYKDIETITSTKNIAMLKGWNLPSPKVMLVYYVVKYPRQILVDFNNQNWAPYRCAHIGESL